VKDEILREGRYLRIRKKKSPKEQKRKNKAVNATEQTTKNAIKREGTAKRGTTTGEIT
jgi:hypothetical protein